MQIFEPMPVVICESCGEYPANSMELKEGKMTYTFWCGNRDCPEWRKGWVMEALRELDKGLLKKEKGKS